MTTREVYLRFEGKLIGRKRMRRIVCEVVSKMPVKIIDFVTENCWFVCSMEDAWAYTFTGNDIANQHMVFISDELLAQPEAQVRYTVAHEIGHVILRHKNSTYARQTPQEISKQEREVHEFANKYEALKRA